VKARYAERFNALSVRERVMVFAAALVALLAMVYTLMIEPELIKQRRTATAILQKQSEMKAFEAQVTKLIGSRARDPDRAERERLAQLRSELGDLEVRIAAEERKFTAPAQMRAVIEGLLARSRGVALVEMKTLATTTIATASKPVPAIKPPAKPALPERLIYRHGLELTVSGAYLDLLAYVRDLERLPTQLYWGGLELDAAAYPKVSMKLTVYTLSLDRAWLSV
jgi:MSHA biogenesis protein MshJ